MNQQKMKEIPFIILFAFIMNTKILQKEYSLASNFPFLYFQTCLILELKDNRCLITLDLGLFYIIWPKENILQVKDSRP